MIVACPSCQTRFKLDPVKLQPVGRHVRCAKCSHRWLQLPEGMELPPGLMPPALDEPAFDEPESPAEPTPAAVEEPSESPADETPADETPETVAAETGTAEEPAEAAAESSPRPPETPAEMALSLAAIAEQVAAAGEAGAAAEKPTPKLGSPGAGLRLGVRMTGPITVPPQMRPARPARRSSGLGLLLMAGVVIGLLVAAYVFRDAISRTIPGADAIYSLLGLSTDNPAADLEISIDKVDTQDDEGKRFFSVTATVFNLSEYPVDMPPLMIVPMDEGGNQMEPILFRLRERVAEPGQNIKFQKSFDNWPITAKSFVLTVADAP